MDQTTYAEDHFLFETGIDARYGHRIIDQQSRVWSRYLCMITGFTHYLADKKVIFVAFAIEDEGCNTKNLVFDSTRSIVTTWS